MKGQLFSFISSDSVRNPLAKGLVLPELRCAKNQGNFRKDILVYPSVSSKRKNEETPIAKQTHVKGQRNNQHKIIQKDIVEGYLYFYL